ncbi:B-cell antigen receptor complex-associated protein beta chain [Lepisosteus oculatus]|uniref:B-cell antigen receptor complex-associated protein beta chain n=1 Tax=Lepisosteus oculatus TaxID=7918 RepID=UPI00371DE63C
MALRIVPCVLFGSLFSYLVNVSIVPVGGDRVHQKPRFLGVRSGSAISMFCYISLGNHTNEVQWVKTLKHDASDEVLVTESDTVKFKGSVKDNNSTITIMGVRSEHSGIYFCKYDSVKGPGSELLVYSSLKPEDALKKSKMKDAIILIQTFLLVLCILVPLLWFKYKGKSEDRDYEEPEDDHTYEGLEIEQCAMYEDIMTLRQTPETAWEQGEHPCQE